MTDLDTLTKRFVIAYAKFTEGLVIGYAEHDKCLVKGKFVDPNPKWAQDRLSRLRAGDVLLPLKDIPSQEVIAYTRAHSNTVLLIEYLRRISSGTNNAPRLTPEFAKLIADALQYGWKEGTFTAIDAGYLKSLRDNIKAMIDAGDMDAENLAAALGATSKAEAAKAIAALLMGTTPSAIDNLMHPRAGRKKKG